MREAVLKSHLRTLYAQGEKAFTLLETMVAVGILVVALFTATTQMPELIDSFRRKNVRQTIHEDVRRARAEAASEGARAFVEILPGNASYRIALDYPLYGNPPSAERVIVMRRLPNQFTFATTQPIMFDARGYLIDSNGDPSQTTLSLRLRGDEFTAGSIFASGFVHYE